MRAIIMLLAAAVSLAAIAAQPLYRWVDSEGKVHYSDQPPPPSVRQVEERNLSGTRGAQQLPYELEQAVRNFPVTLYTTACGAACAEARKLLSKRGVPHSELDASHIETQKELMGLIGGDLVVPVLKVGRSVLRGFEETLWNRELDAAGYPKTALIQVTPKRPQPPKAVQSPTDETELQTPGSETGGEPSPAGSGEEG